MKKYKARCWTVLCVVIAVLMLTQHARAIDDVFGDLYDDNTSHALSKLPEATQNDSELTKDIYLNKKMLGRFDGAIKDLRKIVSAGGWPVLKSKGKRLRLKQSGREIAILKKQLLIRGDLDPDYFGRKDYFDERLQRALLRFQKRHALRQNGYVDPRTREMLSISASTRLRQLQTNLVRLRNAISKNKGDRYVVVNVPDFTLQAVHDDKVELASRVVVGHPTRETPTLSVHIQGVNFNPYWHVPQSLVDADLIPAQQKKGNYLEEQKIRAFESWGGREVPLSEINWNGPQASRLKYRQEPGPFNALGAVRINMPNPDIIYLHDTPLKKLFGQSFRAYSAGCIRVQRIQELARWILDDHPKWSNSKITDAFEQQTRADVKIAKPIPVHLIYLTAWVSKDGELQYRHDIYKRDGQGLEGRRIAQNRGGRPLAP